MNSANFHDSMIEFLTKAKANGIAVTPEMVSTIAASPGILAALLALLGQIASNPALLQIIVDLLAGLIPAAKT